MTPTRERRASSRGGRPSTCNRAGVVTPEPLTDLQGGGLAGPVGTQYCGHRTLSGHEVERVDHGPIAVPFDQAGDHESRMLAGCGGFFGHATSLGKDPGGARAGLLRNNGVVKIAAAPPHASGRHEPGHDVAGRDRVAASLLNEGPATASQLATRLGISATAVRRHLDSLSADGMVQGTDRPPYGPQPTRGRGRPARTFALTAQGRGQFPAEYDELAADALGFVEEFGGHDAVTAFAESRGAALESRLRAILGDDWRTRLRR